MVDLPARGVGCVGHSWFDGFVVAGPPCYVGDLCDLFFRRCVALSAGHSEVLLLSGDLSAGYVHFFGAGRFWGVVGTLIVEYSVLGFDYFVCLFFERSCLSIVDFLRRIG